MNQEGLRTRHSGIVQSTSMSTLIDGAVQAPGRTVRVRRATLGPRSLLLPLLVLVLEPGIPLEAPVIATPPYPWTSGEVRKVRYGAVASPLDAADETLRPE